jgi:hypothetical protein
VRCAGASLRGMCQTLNWYPRKEQPGLGRYDAPLKKASPEDIDLRNDPLSFTDQISPIGAECAMPLGSVADLPPIPQATARAGVACACPIDALPPKPRLLRCP